MTDAAFQTEYEFTLPRGYVDDDGTLHREGRMRLATAADEIQPLNDPRVQSNESFLTILLLGRTVTDLGDLETVDETVIQNLFVADLEYLQELYERINERGANAVPTACPDCGEEFEVDVQSGAPVTGADAPAAGQSSSSAPTGLDPTSTGGADLLDGVEAGATASAGEQPAATGGAGDDGAAGAAGAGAVDDGPTGDELTDDDTTGEVREATDGGDEEVGAGNSPE